MLKEFNKRINKVSIAKLVVSLIIVIALSIGIFQFKENFEDFSDYQLYLLLFEIALTVVAAGLIFFKVEGKKVVIYNLIIVFFLSIIVALYYDFLNEMYSRASEQGFWYSFARFAVSVGFCFLLYLLGIALFGRMRVAIIVMTVIFFILGIVTYLILAFRGTRLTFIDITAIGTAADVISGYTTIPVNDYLWLALVAVLPVIPFLLDLEAYHFKIKSVSRLAFYLVFLYGFFGIFSSPFETLEYSWFEDENSYIFSFFSNAKLLTLNPSYKYSIDKTEEIISSADSKVTFLPSSYNAEEEIKKKFPEYVQNNGTTKPNIIVVMNESLTDLGIYNEKLDTAKQVMPNILNLKNALIGDLYVDVRGGGTADSEYTFLTGNTTLLLPNNARPYQLYVNEDSPNLVEQLEDVGYKTAAIHPGVNTAWDRDKVYDYFGFDEFIWGSSFLDSKYLRTSTLKTDLETYKKIFQLYESKGKDPLFVFDVTIQNHGGYQQGYENLEKLAVEEEVPKEVVEFLSLMKASDNDFAELINYFSAVKEPTVILMFGDHQPQLTSGYLESTFDDYDNLTIEEVQQLQLTPYVYWANYPLPSEQIGPISANYLSTILLECAGLKPSAYNTYLANLHEKLNVINRKGIVTDEGDYYQLKDSSIPSEYKELLDDYKDVLYYNMVDVSKVDPELFEIQNE